MRLILFVQELSDLKKTLNVEVEQLRAVSVLFNLSSSALVQIKFVCNFYLIKSKLGISRSEDHSSAATRGCFY
jgi:hypothetical protein